MGDSAKAGICGCLEKQDLEKSLVILWGPPSDIPTEGIDNSGIQSTQGGAGRGGVNGGHFNLRSPDFWGMMTLFREKMTLLLEETPVSVPA